MEPIDMEVDFKTYCPLCVNRDLNEHQDPCNECLEYGTNENSTKPVLFKEQKK